MEIGTGNSCTLLPASWTIAAYLETFPAQAAFKIFKGFCTASRIRSKWRTNQKRVYKDSASEILYRSVRSGKTSRIASVLSLPTRFSKQLPAACPQRAWRRKTMASSAIVVGQFKHARFTCPAESKFFTAGTTRKDLRAACAEKQQTRQLTRRSL